MNHQFPIEKYKSQKKFALTTWVVEAGPAFYKDTIAGVQEGIKSADAAIKERSREAFSTAK